MSIALLTGVTGLKAHQQRLDVIAANIANVNTIGYRSGRVLFQDLFSQTIRGGSPPIGNFGGSNPLQIGLGVQIASIDTNFEQGSLITTGIASDLAIQGNGFFVLSDGEKHFFSRDGSFTLNANGILIEPGTGMRVQGYVADATGVIDTNTPPRDISIPLGGTGIVRASTSASFIGNLNPTEDPANPGKTVIRNIQVVDSLGSTRNVTLTFVKQTTPDNSWLWQAEFDGNIVGGGGAADLVYFNTDGTFNEVTTGPLSFTISAAALAAADPGTGGSLPANLTVNMDFNQVTQLASGDDLGSDFTLQNQDGYSRGVLERFTIGSSGELTGIFSNGLNRVIAQVAIATFSNVGGLIREGSNMFLDTPASGSPQIGPPESGSRGSVSGGVLENSNVDLGAEFSDLIITQRGYQANARTVTAADTLLQETVNLVR
jgi:flagellar hook protein FlgE